MHIHSYIHMYSTFIYFDTFVFVLTNRLLLEIVCHALLVAQTSVCLRPFFYKCGCLSTLAGIEPPTSSIQHHPPSVSFFLPPSLLPSLPPLTSRVNMCAKNKILLIRSSWLSVKFSEPARAWKILQLAAAHCSMLQLTAWHCNSQQYTAIHCDAPTGEKIVKTCWNVEARQHTATHCSTLQHTAEHCDTACCSVLQRVAQCCRVLPSGVGTSPRQQRCARQRVRQVLKNLSVPCTCLAHSNALLHTAAHCSTLPHVWSTWACLVRLQTHCNTLQHAATHCNTLQHTTTHCNTLQQCPARIDQSPSACATLPEPVCVTLIYFNSETSQWFLLPPSTSLLPHLIP